MERKTILKEQGFRGRIIFSAQPKDNMLEITTEDNGLGIKDADSKKIFTPFFTTKEILHKPVTLQALEQKIKETTS